ncbi:hypothetical protein THAOC_24717, partial [Thalassiosira oceanica]
VPCLLRAGRKECKDTPREKPEAGSPFPRRSGALALAGRASPQSKESKSQRKGRNHGTGSDPTQRNGWTLQWIGH